MDFLYFLNSLTRPDKLKLDSVMEAHMFYRISMLVCNDIKRFIYLTDPLLGRKTKSIKSVKN